MLLIGLVIFSALSILVRDLLKAAISLAAASIFLALVFFRMNAVYAGVFEVSVVAGLITVLFITAIALTRSDEQVPESRYHKFIFPLFFGALLLIDLLVMKSLRGRIPSISSPETRTFGEVMWNERSFDLIGQIGAIFAGVLAVLALFRSSDKSPQGGKHE
jgi:NADH-quinone oxidoreductase subunit J